MPSHGISFRYKGDFNKANKFLQKILKRGYIKIIEKYAKEGVSALSLATPKDTGLTAASWGYEVVESDDSIVIYFTNSNVVNDWYNVAILLQFGHGTRNGGYVAGRDYINPAITPILEKLAGEAWKEVTDIS